MVDNRLSQYQVNSLRELLQLSEDDLSFLVKNIEYQLNGLGGLPIDDSGSIDLTQETSNHPKEMREILDEIAKSAKKLCNLVTRYDAKTDRTLDIGSHYFRLPPSKVEPNGVKHFECIRVHDFLQELVSKAELESDYHATFVKAKSQNVVAKIYQAWNWAYPSAADNMIKFSSNNQFINMVAIVTGWDAELARKNVGNFLTRN
ncbi:hypothetical protein GT360_19530 [Vibrio astriarenae]|uniref:Uncharacterized protein n=1 Tax=Vibrio astriarenae TaxID=1481923 RepID=A0A7Z2T7I6_9VIBR|nr:hypothetical protein [Vibrio astriarenae]QIA65715.1 hypothetical protein GT360_19530 [Vibrio astriarenae]